MGMGEWKGRGQWGREGRIMFQTQQSTFLRGRERGGGWEGRDGESV